MTSSNSFRASVSPLVTSIPVFYGFNGSRDRRSQGHLRPAPWAPQFCLCLSPEGSCFPLPSKGGESLGPGYLGSIMTLVCIPCPPTVCRWSCALLTTRVLGTLTTGETSVSPRVQGEGACSPGHLLTTPSSTCSPGLYTGGRPGPPPSQASLCAEPVSCPPWLVLHARDALPDNGAAPDGEGGAGERAPLEEVVSIPPGQG